MSHFHKFMLNLQENMAQKITMDNRFMNNITTATFNVGNKAMPREK